MKKIRNAHHNHDHIICSFESEKATFRYQAAHAKPRDDLYIFETKNSYWLRRYFQLEGCHISSETFYITIADLYRSKNHYDKRVSHLLSRLPGLIDYAISYEAPDKGMTKETSKKVSKKASVYYLDGDYDYAA